MKKLLLTIAAAALATGSALADHHAKLDPAKADVKITVTGNDQMKFDKEALEATEGQVVALTFKNIGKLPVVAMGHNLIIVKPGTDQVKFAMSGISNKPDHLPVDKALLEAIVAKTKVLGPGEEQTIVFKAGAPGKYPYLCTFPGHFGVMKGILTVKAK